MDLQDMSTGKLNRVRVSIQYLFNSLLTGMDQSLNYKTQREINCPYKDITVMTLHSIAVMQSYISFPSRSTLV